MGRHENQSIKNGQGTLDTTKTKDVRDSGGGKHSDEDRGDQDQRDQDNQE